MALGMHVSRSARQPSHPATLAGAAVSWCLSGVSCAPSYPVGSLGRLPGERLRKLVAGVDAEFLVGVAEVVFHGLRAEEQRGRGFPRCSSCCEQKRNLQFLRCQFVDDAGVLPSARLARGRELGASAIGPGAGIEALEHVRGRAELLAGQNPVPGPPQTFPVCQPCARRLECIGCLLVLAERPLEGCRKAGIRRQQPLATQSAGERPWLPLGIRRGCELVGDLLSLGVAAEPDVGVDELCRGREIDVGDRKVAQQLLYLLEVPGRTGGVAATELEIAERRCRPDLVKLYSELMAEVERFGGAGPAFLLLAAARLQPRQPRQAKRQLGPLPALACQIDRFLVSGLAIAQRSVVA